ncbi:MAG: TonB-dependent receptor [Candidatus Acidiferrales bacterium]
MIFRNASKKIAISLATFVALTVSFFLSVPLHAQVAGATLSGVVTDSSGAVVANATVSIRNTATGITREVTTDVAGFYSAPNLSPAVYEVTGSAPGFSTRVQTGITLTVGAQQVLNFSLQVGQVTQRVVVTGEAPAVDLASSTISAEVNSTTVLELPLNGRDWSSLATLQPGVIGIHTQFATSGTVNKGNRGFGDQLSTSGHRPNENNYRINGVSVNDYTNGAPGSVIGLQLGVDGIQEFSVLTTNYSAEYGRTSGGVINAIMKSGSNAFHGDAYWFLRDEGLDAKNFFDSKTLPIPPFHRNQFGGSAGGPIRKDKTFFFADYEGIRQSLSLTFHSLVPSTNARNGLLASGQLPFVAGKTNANGVDLQVVPYLGFWPTPNGGLPPGGNGNTAFYDASGVQSYAENYVTGRVDHKISNTDSLDGVYFFDRSPQTTPDNLLDQTSETFSQRQMFGLEETHVFSPTVTNAARVGYSRVIGKVLSPVSALKPIAGDTTLGILSGLTAPILSISELGGGGNLMQGSLGSGSQFNHLQNSFQFYDDAFLTRGTHSMKFGFAFERIQFNEIARPRPRGTFVFDSLQTFLQNQPTNVLVLDPTHSQEMGTRMSAFGAYVQDDWRFRPNLTLNFGLRYEPTSLPSEAHNGYGVVKDFFNGTITPVAHLWSHNQTLRNFAPRVGFSWDPFHNGKTAVRGGFGIFDVLPLPWEYTQQAAQALPFAYQASKAPLPPGSFPKLAGVSPPLIGATPNPTNALSYHAEQNPHRNYAMNWNLNIQRELTGSTTVMVGYVGSHTLHMPYTTDDSNMVIAKLIPGVGDLWPCGPAVAFGSCLAGGGTRANPNVGVLRPTFWSDGATYEALQAQVTKRMSHGFQAQGSYTWGKCIDNGSGGHIGDPYKNSLSSLIFFSRQSTHGPCDFQITHNFVLNYIWQVPGPKSGSGILSILAGGWEIGGILAASTGSPFTLLIGGDPLGQNSTDTADYPNRLAGCNPINGNYRTTLQYLNLSCFGLPQATPAIAAQCQPFGLRAPGKNGPSDPGSAGIAGTCANLFGNAGRNQIYGPGLLNFDFSVFKNNYIRRISETFNVQFRFEFFNVFNHPNFQSPFGTATLFNADGTPGGGAGLLTGTENPSRQIQLGMKVVW